VLALTLPVGCSDEDADDSATSALLLDLSSTTPETRLAAARQLGLQRETRAVEPLTTLLGDIRLDVRKAAAQALGRIGDPRAVEPLGRVLGQHDEDGELRRLCAAALGSIEDPAAIPPLEAAMHAEDEELAFAAAYALRQMGEPALDVLLAGLKAERAQTKRAAATALGGLTSDRAREAMRALLDDPDPMLRLAAAENLATRPEQVEPEPIVAMLLDPNETVRRGMPRIIHRLGERAIPALAAILEKDSRTVERTRADGKVVEVSVKWAQNEAVDILMKYRSARALRPLVVALDRPIRNRDAVRAYLRRQFASDAWHRELLGLCREGASEERNTAFMLLYAFVGERLVGNDDAADRQRILREAGFQGPAALVAVCNEAAKRDDSTVRFHASLMLCALGDRRGAAAVEQQFWKDMQTIRARKGDHKQSRERAAQALTALAGVADRALGDKLVPLLKEGKQWGKQWDGLRGRIAAVLGKVGDPDYIRPLTAFLTSRPHDYAASQAARSLGRIGAKQAFDDILRFVKPLPDDQYYVAARRNCYEGLLGCDRARAYTEVGKIFVALPAHKHSGLKNIVDFYRDHPDSAAVGPLLHWINHDVRLIRDEVHEGLIAIGRRDLSWLTDGLDAESSARRRTLAGVIADGFGHEAVPLLVEAAADESPRKRQGAVWALGCIGGQEASRVVGKAFEDEHWAVRSAAAWSAGRLQDPDYVPGMIAMLEDANASVRSMAAQKLGDMSSDAAVEPLIAALDDADPRVRAYAALSLAALRAERALGPIRELLDDPDPDVQEAATYAVRTLAAASDGAALPVSTSGK
jgi:HEAT repeat protein